MDTAMTINPETTTTTQRKSLMISPAMGCPLQLAMEELARAAVQQHVLYQEGECQPRPELLDRLEAWSSLHALIRSRICVASRETAISADDRDVVLDQVSRRLVEIATPSQLRHLLATLTACARATTCPLGTMAVEDAPAASA